MSLESHLDVLRRRHGDVDRALKQVRASPSAGDDEIGALKRRKLRLKDEIARMESAAA